MSADERCPRCQRLLVIKHVGHNSFLGCTGYPDCDYKRGLREQSEIEPENLGVPCPECGEELQLKSGRYGLFVGCSNFPACEFVTEPDAGNDDTIQCPECKKGQLRQKTSRRGTVFYACDQYPTCQFTVNQPPVDESCPKCGFALLVKRKTASGVRKVCIQKQCDYKSDTL
ncbi:type I DNA topoisomerase [Idiomarina piscisalsi]|uniref:DNA topoisomerase type IA zn finger domain-containing protein n=1 Tax=Idiomarina piscisalsi TaxID=1096243 RepID=A0A432YSB7_9GAMM|nr:type I DNA topoisomerase [Idiomarina piscisalsi]RUO64419.1 hypothetical protein CWI73_06900 [Idiomarina piscisalsi]